MVCIVFVVFVFLVCVLLFVIVCACCMVWSVVCVVVRWCGLYGPIGVVCGDCVCVFDVCVCGCVARVCLHVLVVCVVFGV